MRHIRAPKGWSKASLESVAIVQTGISKSSARRLLHSLTVPYLRVANVQDGYVDLTVLKTMDIERDALSRFCLQSGDVLLTEGGDYDKLGRGCVWRGQVAPCIHQNHVFVVRPRAGKLAPEFLSGQTSSSYGRGYFLACSKQTTNLASINSTQLKQFPVLLPSYDEQCRVIGTLSIWNQAIEQAERRLALSSRHKRALMQHLLSGRRRFPEFVKSKKMKDTLLGPLAMDWQLCAIAGVFKRVMRKNGASTTLVLTASGQHGLIDQREFFDRNVSGESLEGYYLLKRGEFAYNRSAMNGYPHGAVKRLDGHECGAVSTLYHCFALTDKESDSDFFRHFFEFGLLNRQLRRICQVGGRAHGLLNVTAGDFEKMVIPVPSREEQKRIAMVLNECDEEIRQLTVQVDALRRQKKGLMEKLLTGEVRVTDRTGDLA